MTLQEAMDAAFERFDRALAAKDAEAMFEANEAIRSATERWAASLKEAQRLQ